MVLALRRVGPRYLLPVLVAGALLITGLSVYTAHDGQDTKQPVLVELAVPQLETLAAASAASVALDGGAASRARQSAADQALASAIASVGDAVLASVPADGLEVSQRYQFAPLLAVRATPEALAALRALPHVSEIYPDRLTRLPPSSASPTVDGTGVNLNGTADLIGASTAWRWGYTGAGWSVAVLDTGLRTSHQFFANKTIVEACFSKGRDGAAGAGDCPNGRSTQTGAGAAAPFSSQYDGFDHGTHVAGIAAGQSGSLAGIAKDANVVAIQVFSRLTPQDCGDVDPCLASWDSDTVAALDWVYANRTTSRIASANMSLGGDVESNTCNGDAHRSIIEQLRAAGIATAIAAGNDGSCRGITAPACITQSIAVASSTDADAPSSFTNWHGTMVSVFAPGSNIYSSTGTSDASYASWNGTSMATPHVTGAWALMRQVSPNASVSDLLSAIKQTGVAITSTCDSRRTAIARLRVDRAIASLVVYRLTLQSTADGTTDPAPGTTSYPAGTQVQVRAIPDTYASFLGWSGAASGTTSPVTITMDGDKTVTASFMHIAPPGVSGRQEVNRSFSQAEYVNVLSWHVGAAHQGLNIAGYRLYVIQGSAATLLAELGTDRTQYVHRHAARGATAYRVTIVTGDGREGEPATVVVS